MPGKSSATAAAGAELPGYGGRARGASISLIIPVLNEAASIVALLETLQDWRGAGHELIVVDGGSHDGTPQLAQKAASRVLRAERGRARQMNAGAAVVQGEWLLFLHADTYLPMSAAQSIVAADQAQWGWFDISLDHPGLMYGFIAWSMNRRARLTHVCTGDQAMFVRRQLFYRLAGFPDIPLMEDIAISKKLRRNSSPLVIAARATTSSRRWRQGGVFRTILHMWKLRCLYFLGVDPERLVKEYYPDHGH